MEFNLILQYGLPYLIAITLALLFIGIKGPRIMLQDYPKSIQNAVPPKTKEEKRQTYVYALPVLLIMIGYPLATGAYLTVLHHWHFWQTFSFVWGLSMLFNLYDLLIIDWIVFCTITPGFLVIPGTEGNKGYKDYWFHFVGFLKGILITGVISLASSGIICLLCSNQRVVSFSLR